MRAQTLVSRIVAAGIFLAAVHAEADPKDPPEPAPAPVIDPNTARGRAAFLRGKQLSDNGQWVEALAAFEEAAAARDAPLVQYSIAYCQRALGRYVAARRTFRRVLASTEGLDPGRMEDAKAFADELDQLVARVRVTLDPPSTPLVVDGRALRAVTEDGVTTYVTLPGPAEGARVPDDKTFAVELDPGVHIFRATRPGHADAVVQKSYRPGETATLDLHLDLLPAHVDVSSEPPQAIVRVDGREAGLAPIPVYRPAGTYTIEVVRDGFETYTATFHLEAGQGAQLRAKLVPVRPQVWTSWWFWTSAAAVVGGGVAAIVLTRPHPYDGGSLNWVARPSAAGTSPMGWAAPPAIHW